MVKNLGSAENNKSKTSYFFDKFVLILGYILSIWLVIFELLTFPKIMISQTTLIIFMAALLCGAYLYKKGKISKARFYSNMMGILLWIWVILIAIKYILAYY